MKKLIAACGGLLVLLALVFTGAVAWLSQDFHAALMRQIAQSGLAQAQEQQFMPGLLRAHNSGRLQLAQSYCAGCGVLEYQGTLYHGLGTLLQGPLALASADYQLQWPELPLQPALPPLQLRARQALSHGLTPALKAKLTLPASRHTLTSTQHDYQLQQDGLSGEIRPSQLQLNSPGFALARDGQDWLQLQHSHWQAAASDQLTLNAQVSQLAIPLWRWQGEKLSLDYRQQGSSKRLHASLKATVQSGQLDDVAHDKASAQLQLQRLNLDATLAFARELPRLFSPQTTGAARMLGLFSLYSVHGPGFFAPHPALSLSAKDVPLDGGLLDMQVDLAVTKQTTSPPMHPLEWRQALRGHIDISAPPQQLASLWHWAAPLMHYITGLPQSYRQMQQQGWVENLPDGRQRLRITLDPDTGPRQS